MLAFVQSHCTLFAKKIQVTKSLPIKGTESEVAGMISATSSMKTVRDNKTVIPEKWSMKSYQ